MTPCKWNGSGNPRILAGRHAPECPSEATGGDLRAEECPGCLPCPEPHCSGDECRGRNHAETVCAECLNAARDNLRAIGYMCGTPLLEEALEAGVDSEALMLRGPAANTDAWQFRALSAMFGRIDAAYLEDNRDEDHPAWVLGWIENEWREAFEQPTDLRSTIARSLAYIGERLHIVAGLTEMPDGSQPPEFADAAGRLRQLHDHLDDVLREQLRAEKGAPCVQCGKAMTRVTNDRSGDEVGHVRKGTEQEGAQDEYECQRCHRAVSGDQYRYAVHVAHLAHADRLTARDMSRQHGVPEGSVRGWATLRQGEAAPRVRKRGKDENGLQLYDVSDVLAMKARTEKEPA